MSEEEAGGRRVDFRAVFNIESRALLSHILIDKITTCRRAKLSVLVYRGSTTLKKQHEVAQKIVKQCTAHNDWTRKISADCGGSAGGLLPPGRYILFHGCLMSLGSLEH